MRIPESTQSYRYYNQQDLETLSFIQKAKDAGLQLNEIKELLTLNLEDRIQVQHVIEQRLNKIDERIQELVGLKQRLSTWLEDCKTTENNCCPILMELKH